MLAVYMSPTIVAAAYDARLLMVELVEKLSLLPVKTVIRSSVLGLATSLLQHMIWM